MSKRLIKNVEEYVNLYIDDATGIAWIENGKTGSGHSCHPNIDKTGSVRGMKKLGFWGKNDMIVRSNGYQYNVTRLVVGDKYDEIVAYHCKCEGCRIRRNINATKYILDELDEG